MKSFYRWAFFSACLGACGPRTSFSPESIRISMYPDDKQAAISFTFDDNNPSCFTTIVPMLKKYGIPATFFVIPGTIKSEEEWEKWRALGAEGFEIGNHSMNHPNLKDITDKDKLEEEINKAYEVIEAKTGKAPFSFAHPFHETNDTVDQVVFQKHYASRLSPPGFCRWWGAVAESTDKMFDNDMEKVLKNHEWNVVSAHGIKDGWSPMSEELLEHTLQFVKEREDVLSVDTFEGLSKYKIEREHTKLKVTEEGGTVTVSLSNDLNPSVFSRPLTLVLEGDYRNREITSLGDSGILKINCMDDRLLMTVRPNARIQIR